MKKILSSFIVAVVLGSSFFAMDANVIDGVDEKAGKIMDQVEIQSQFGDEDYSATVSLIIEKPDEATQQMKYKLFQRSSQDQFSMIQLFPEADKGTGYLQDGDNLWVYDPIGRKFSHSSLKEQLGDSDTSTGDLNNNDTWRDDFQITGFEKGMLGKYSVYIITLEAITTEPEYAKQVEYVRTDYPVTLKVEDYSANGRLMRTQLLPKYTKVNGYYIPTQIIQRDEVNKGEQTQILISEVSFTNIPDKVFTKAYLENIN
ncbi:MAG: hypothetical protein BKP49_06965 [Treponema sp. CETP13]|nr:MAG: hypothetical protein BKP49_06965 [Treponema sp. CETP13]